MKLGYTRGTGARGRRGHRREHRAAEGLGFDSFWTAEAYGSDALTPLAWWGAKTSQHQARHVDRADLRAHAGGDGDGGDDARPSLRRPRDPRARCVGAAGGRRLVRTAVPAAAGAHARVRRDHRGGSSRARSRSSSPASTTSMPYPGGIGPRQAAEVDRAPAAHRHPDLPRRRRAEERRDGGGDRRRLAADLLLAEERRLLPRRRCAEGFARPGARRTPETSRSRVRACRSSPTTTSRRRPTSCGRRSRCTSAAWARGRRTSTTTSSRGWATRTSARRSRSCTSHGDKREAMAAVPTTHRRGHVADRPGRRRSGRAGGVEGDVRDDAARRRAALGAAADGGAGAGVGCGGSAGAIRRGRRWRYTGRSRRPG